MKRLLVFVFTVTLLGSCSVHRGNIYPSNVQFTTPNFKYVNTIQGDATATYIIGFGGISKEGLINEAKTKMYSNYFPEDNQIITNLTVDVKQTFYTIFYWKHTVYVTADIYEFK